MEIWGFDPGAAPIPSQEDLCLQPGCVINVICELRMNGVKEEAVYTDARHLSR